MPEQIVAIPVQREEQIMSLHDQALRITSSRDHDPPTSITSFHDQSSRIIFSHDHDPPKQITSSQNNQTPRITSMRDHDQPEKINLPYGSVPLVEYEKQKPAPVVGNTTYTHDSRKTQEQPQHLSFM